MRSVLESPILTIGQSCTLGSPDLQQSSVNPTPGLFIQQEGRAPCSGEITQWAICYYNPETFTTRKTFQILLELWRNEEIRFFHHVGSNSVTITVPNQPEAFQCVNVTIDQEDRISVLQNDSVGVYLASTSNLPVVTSNSGSSDSRVYFVQVSAIPPSSVAIFGDGAPMATQLPSHAIHVTATIGKIATLKPKFVHKFKCIL